MSCSAYERPNRVADADLARCSTSARRPPRCTQVAQDAGRVSRWRWAQGSQRRRPTHSTSPIAKRRPSRPSRSRPRRRRCGAPPPARARSRRGQSRPRGSRRARCRPCRRRSPRRRSSGRPPAPRPGTARTASTVCAGAAASGAIDQRLDDARRRVGAAGRRVFGRSGARTAAGRHSPSPISPNDRAGRDAEQHHPALAAAPEEAPGPDEVLADRHEPEAVLRAASRPGPRRARRRDRGSRPRKRRVWSPVRFYPMRQRLRSARAATRAIGIAPSRQARSRSRSRAERRRATARAARAKPLVVRAPPQSGRRAPTAPTRSGAPPRRHARPPRRRVPDRAGRPGVRGRPRGR